MSRKRATMIWAMLSILIAAPIAAAAASPLIAWRDPIYIVAGFAGVIAMALLLLQPLLAGGVLPLVSVLQRRRAHRMVGALLVVGVIVHVAGLWITSPPDVVDALLFASPTPFSFWGVVAMWAVFSTAVLALLRGRIRPRIWRRIHSALAIIVVLGGVVHALLIQGTMEPVSKAVLCVAVIAATLFALLKLKLFVQLDSSASAHTKNAE